MRLVQDKLGQFNLTWIFIILSPLFVALIFIFRHSSSAQFKLLFLAAFLYLALAIGHHYKDKSLTFEILIEYILIALFALIVIQSFL